MTYRCGDLSYRRKGEQWMMAQLPCFSLAALSPGESSPWLEEGGDEEREKFK